MHLYRPTNKSTIALPHGRTFENADDTDDDPFIGVDLHGEVYSVEHLARSLNLFHTIDDHLERKKLAQFVRYVERRIVEHVPTQCNVPTSWFYVYLFLNFISWPRSVVKRGV